MKRRELLTGLAAATLASGCTSQAPRKVQTSQPPRYSSPVPLPAPATTDTISLEKAIGKRRSLRAFRPDPLPMATIGQLLWAGQGITSPEGKRAAPSAGALYPLELYVVTPKQVMHYLPDGHRAEIRAASDLRPGLKAAAVGQSSVGTAPAVIAVAAVPSRLSHRYGAQSEEFVQIEVGHASQNILLQAAALGLAAVPVGSLDASRAADTLALAPDETVLYLIPVGHGPLTDRSQVPVRSGALEIRITRVPRCVARRFKTRASFQVRRVLPLKHPASAVRSPIPGVSGSRTGAPRRCSTDVGRGC